MDDIVVKVALLGAIVCWIYMGWKEYRWRRRSLEPDRSVQRGIIKNPDHPENRREDRNSD